MSLPSHNYSSPSIDLTAQNMPQLSHNLRSVNIDWNALLQQMLHGAESLGLSAWNDVEPYAKSEFTKYLNNVQLIQQLLSGGTITQAEATALDQMQRNSNQAVLCTVEGIGLLVAQQLINSALNAVASAINIAVGFALIA